MRRAVTLLIPLLAACEAALPAPATVVVEPTTTAAPAAGSAAPAVDPATLVPPPPAIEAPGQQGCLLTASGSIPLRFEPTAPPFVTLTGASATIDLTTAGPGAGAVGRSVHRGFTMQGLVAADDLPIAPAKAMVWAGFLVPMSEARFVWRATAPGTITVSFLPDEAIQILPEAGFTQQALACDAISLDGPSFDARSVTPRSPKEHEALLRAGKTVPLSRTPDGPPVARIRVGNEDAFVTVIEARGRRSLVVREQANTLVFGWVAASDLKPIPKDQIGEALGGGGFGLSGIGEGGGTRSSVRCDRITPLVAEIAGVRRTIGSIAVGAVVQLRERKGDLWPIELPDGFSADPGAQIGVLAAHLTGCADAR
ncbi:MAG: hypothetical protein QM820_10135 [Minicystis sp.]